MLQQSHAEANVEPMGRGTEGRYDVIAVLANKRPSWHVTTFAYGERAGPPPPPPPLSWPSKLSSFARASF